jgi:hypothetical protein
VERAVEPRSKAIRDHPGRSLSRLSNCETVLTHLPAGVVMMVVMTMMVRLRKCRRRYHQDHGEKQSLFHVHDHNNKVTARYTASRNFRVTHPP